MNGLERYNQGRSVMAKITLVIVIIIAIGAVLSALSCFFGSATLDECFVNLLMPEIVTFMTTTGIIGIFLIIVYALLCDYFRTKPFWDN